MVGPLAEMTDEQVQAFKDKWIDGLFNVSWRWRLSPSLHEPFKQIANADHMLEAFAEFASTNSTGADFMLRTAILTLAGCQSIDGANEELQRRNKLDIEFKTYPYRPRP